jgi:hypothetical protein
MYKCVIELLLLYINHDVAAETENNKRQIKPVSNALN